ncbi:unnamed protein product [Danaus chrysippus]|uniref:(African queen) hypothetical protein n=1 Tax=Danaus chrysippus TaxID=151541 RepID=A0A8J2VYV0_9NEOP|nr:unnamed protein product [Danaus chrysippus]
MSEDNTTQLPADDTSLQGYRTRGYATGFLLSYWIPSSKLVFVRRKRNKTHRPSDWWLKIDACAATARWLRLRRFHPPAERGERAGGLLRLYGRKNLLIEAHSSTISRERKILHANYAV